MANSRTRNTAYNFASSVALKVLNLVLSFAARTVFIYALGAAYLGLNGLFSNVLSFLALSELGLGSAIAFLLYKPVAENNQERIRAIMVFYKKCYYVVGSVILLLGVSLMPFLDKMVNLEQDIPENLYLIYFIFLLNSSVSYFFAAYKGAIVGATQEDYKLTSLKIFFQILNVVADIVVLWIFRNFVVYLSVKLALLVVNNLVVAWKIDRMYPYLKEPCHEKLDKAEVLGLFKNVGQVSVFRLGSLLFNSVANIVTSIFVGTIVVGYYSNYNMIVGQLEAVFLLIIGSMGASIGNLVATVSKERQQEVYKTLNMMSFCFYAFCTVCMWQLLNSFVNLWLSDKADFLLSQAVIALICANFYTNCSCQLLERFRAATGNFAIGANLQVVGGVANIILSVILAKAWGLEGVLCSPFLCKIFITVTPFVINVGRKALHFDTLYMLKSYFGQMLLTVALCVLVWYACRPLHMGGWLSFAAETIVTVSLCGGALLAIYYRTPEFADAKARLTKKKNR